MKLLPLKRISVTTVASFHCYCDRSVWITQRLGIRAPPTIKMVKGTLMHSLVECAEKNVHKIAKISDYTEDNFTILRNKLKEFLDKNKPKDLDLCDKSLVDITVSDLLDCITFRYLSRYITCLNNKFYTLGSKKIVREKKIEFDYGEYTIVMKADCYEEYIPGHAIIIDYKDSAKSDLTEYMKIQLDGYAFVLKHGVGLTVDFAMIDFVLYMIQKYYKPGDFIPYLDDFIDKISKDDPPFYYHKNSCNWCPNEIKSKCLELRS